jgi:hypothetical protein
MRCSSVSVVVERHHVRLSTFRTELSAFILNRD